jgi:pimeloyl-ACP methyl ester carboxylesterase
VPAPVLLVHGFASSFERNWEEPGWVALLHEQGREVVGVDLPGHGSMPRPHDPSAYDHMEEVVLDCLPDEAADAVGFSLGAMTLLAAAARAPRRFGRIVLGGIGAGVTQAPEPAVSERLAAAIERGAAAEGDPPEVAAFVRLSRAPGNDPLALAACLRRRVSPLTADQLGQVVSPVLVVCGDQDPAGPPGPLAQLLPDARALVLRGVDHLATARHVGFIDAALGFLDEA